MLKVCGHEVAIELGAAVFITKSNYIHMAMSFVAKLNLGEGGVSETWVRGQDRGPYFFKINNAGRVWVSFNRNPNTNPKTALF